MYAKSPNIDYMTIFESRCMILPVERERLLRDGRGWACQKEEDMSKTISEAKVLKKLGIPDFRHMTKEKVMSFVSMLPYMEPEVAKKALEQFPEFAKIALAITENLKATIEEAIKGNAKNMEAFNGACLDTLESLRTRLSGTELSVEEKTEVIASMLQVLSLMAQKDSENKAFLSGLVRIGVTFSAVCLFCLASILGMKAMANRDAV